MSQHGEPDGQASPGLKTNRDHLIKIIWTVAAEDRGNGKGKKSGALPIKKGERGMVVGRWRSSVAEHWRLKPETLGSIPSGITFLSLYCFIGL